MTIRIEYEVKVVDKDKVLQEVKGESRTATINFMKWLASRFLIQDPAAVTWSAVDITGATRTFPYRGSNYDCLFGHFFGGEGSTTGGIVVGRSTTPYSPYDYKLADMIPHGTATGQLYYGLQGRDDVQVIGNSILFSVFRTFTNQSASDITVTEIGIHLSIGDSGMNARTLLAVRDVLPSPVVVPAGKSLVVRYIFRITF